MRLFGKRRRSAARRRRSRARARQGHKRAQVQEDVPMLWRPIAEIGSLGRGADPPEEPALEPVP